MTLLRGSCVAILGPACSSMSRHLKRGHCSCKQQTFLLMLAADCESVLHVSRCCTMARILCLGVTGGSIFDTVKACTANAGEGRQHVRSSESA